MRPEESDIPLEVKVQVVISHTHCGCWELNRGVLQHLSILATEASFCPNDGLLYFVYMCECVCAQVSKEVRGSLGGVNSLAIGDTGVSEMPEVDVRIQTLIERQALLTAEPPRPLKNLCCLFYLEVTQHPH